MTPIQFPECNVIFAKDQKEYLPLPAYLELFGSGRIISCWKATWKERLIFLLTGRIWLQILTFSEKLQPQFLGLTDPFIKEKK
jgi:hypothetical protein